MYYFSFRHFICNHNVIEIYRKCKIKIGNMNGCVIGVTILFYKNVDNGNMVYPTEHSQFMSYIVSQYILFLNKISCKKSTQKHCY